MKPTIGYYVHHHGSGHLRRAQTILAEIASPVVVLTSASVPAGAFNENVTVVPLPPDVGEAPLHDPTAGGRLHWAPLDPSTLTPRVCEMVNAMVAAKCAVMVCDVSTEAAVLARLCGVAPVVVRQHGVRVDPAHRLAFDLAHRILAPFPEVLDTTPPTKRHLDRTFYAGILTRNSVVDETSSRTGTPMLVIATGGGESNLDGAAIAAASDALPDWQIVVIGRGRQARFDHAARGRAIQYLGWVDDPVAVMRSASVIAGSAGSNLVADAAVASRPLIAIAEPRPFGEQVERVDALNRCDAAVGLSAWPSDPTQWRTYVEQAQRLGSKRLADLVEPDSAYRTARWLESLAENVSEGSQWE